MGLLAAGAGAAEGLDTYLQRMIEQAKLDALTKGQAETSRHNMATEGILSREHDLKAQKQDAALKESKQAHDDLRTDRMQDNGRALGDAIPAGTFMPENDTAVTQMRAGGEGSLLRGVQSRPSVDTGPLQPFDDGRAVPTDSVIKLKSYKQEHEDQQTGKTGDYNVEEKTELVNGKPTPVLFDPRATNKAGGKGRYSLPGTGEDVSDKVQHYEKPPTPDRVLIQTGDGYMRRPDAAKKLGDGGDVPLATTGSTRTMQEGAQMLQPHVKTLQDTATELNKRGLFGPVMSRVRELATKMGTTLDSDDPAQAAKAYGDLGRAISNDPQLNNDRLAGRFAADLGLMATGAGRVHGGARGGGSVQMLQHMKALLSDASTLPMFLGRTDALDGYLSTYAKGPGGKPAADGATPVNAGNEIEYDLNGNVIKKKP